MYFLFDAIYNLIFLFCGLRELLSQKDRNTFNIERWFYFLQLIKSQLLIKNGICE